MSIISHDFKAPLSAFYSITNSRKTKSDKIDRKGIDNFLNRMLNSSIALKLQLDNMLNWSINQQRKISVNKSMYNISVLSYKEIANRLSISQRTVETHKKNILDKLELKTTVDLVKYAIRNGIISL